jgi:hypothetical protein
VAVSDKSAKDDQNRSECADYVDAIERSVGNNRDSQGIGVIRLGRSAVGFVEEISGEDGKECPEFVATRHEINRIAGYWIDEHLEQDFYFFITQSTGSCEWRRSIFMRRRLDRLAEVLGEKSMTELWDDTVTRFRQRHTLSDEDWRIFRDGTEEERETWRQKNIPVWHAGLPDAQ